MQLLCAVSGEIVADVQVPFVLLPRTPRDSHCSRSEALQHVNAIVAKSEGAGIRCVKCCAEMHWQVGHTACQRCAHFKAGRCRAGHEHSLAHVRN